MTDYQRRLNDVESLVRSLAERLRNVEQGIEALPSARTSMLDAVEEWGGQLGKIATEIRTVREELAAFRAGSTDREEIQDAALELVDQRFELQARQIALFQERLSSLESKVFGDVGDDWSEDTSVRNFQHAQAQSREVTSLAKKSRSGEHSFHLNLQLGKILSQPPRPPTINSKSDPVSRRGGSLGSWTRLVGVAALLVTVVGSLVTTLVRACHGLPPPEPPKVQGP